MKKVLLIALVAVCAMGCCKKSAKCEEGQCCKEGEKTECCQKAEEGCCQKAAEATDTTAEAPVEEASAEEAAPAEVAE